MTKKELKLILKEMNVTESQMDQYWNELIEVNHKVKQLNSCGKNWRDMNTAIIKQIPTQKQKDIEAKEKIEQEKIAKEIEENKKRDEEEYYSEHFDEIMIKKIDDKEKLTESELRELIELEIDRIEGDNRRWSQSIESIVKLKDRTFLIPWERGLTECQENEYYDQPIEVVKVEKVVTKTVVEWISKE